MQAFFLNRLMSPVRFLAAGTCATLLVVLTLCLSPVPARASGPTAPPIVVTGPATQIGTLSGTYGGGWDNGADPIGGSFAVGVNGNVIIGDGYGLGWLQISPSGNEAVLADIGSGNYQPGAASARDVYGNVYVASAAVWSSAAYIFKLPYNAATGTYAGFTSTTVPTTNCVGGTQDTAACIFASAVPGALTAGYSAGFADIAFDAQGNFYLSTDTQTKNNSPNTIYECVANSLPSCNSPILVYADSKPMGALTIDPWGNLFFIDGGSLSSGSVSYLKEIPAGGWSSSAPASTPTVLETYTNSASYNSLAGLAVGANGTIYFSNNDGVFAIPNSSANGPNTSAAYVVVTPGGKGLGFDQSGNLYVLNGTNNVVFVPLNQFSLGSVPTGTASTAVSATIVDNGGSCPTSVGTAVTTFGKTSSEFTATAGTTCAAAFTPSNGTFSSGPLSASSFGSSYSVALKVTPSAVGSRTAMLTIADTANSASGTAALSGVGQSAMANVDPGLSATYTTGLNTPEAVVADAAGDVFVADSGAHAVYEIPSGSTTPAAIGSGFVEPVALAFDANGNLFVADEGVPQVVEIPNTGTTGAFVAGTEQTIAGSSTTFGGAALKDAEALAVGPNGTLYISDTGNARVVSLNTISGQSGATLANSSNGLKSPAGLAVDSSNSLYIADSNLNEIFIVSAAGTVSTVTPPSVTQAIGVAVDASGSLIVADGSNGNIVRIPNVGGSLSASSPATIETIAPQASSLWMDSLGDLYAASAGGKSANAIQRTAAAINIGSVQDGATSTGTVYLENSGNQAATLASPAATQPTNTMFTLTPSTTNGCSGTNGPAGASCTFTAEFAPPPGTTTGSYSGTAQIAIGTPSISIPVTISGTATASQAQANTISWTAPASGYVGQAIDLVATSTSTEPVSFASTTTSYCTVAGSTSSGFTATFVAAGRCSIQATVPACSPNGCSANATLYAAAPPVTANIVLTNITSSGEPSLLVNQATWIGDVSPGGFTSSDNPAGGSLAVNPINGDVIDGNQNSQIQIWVPPSASSSTGYPATYTLTAVTGFSGTSGTSLDAANNIYAGRIYWNQAYKVPFINGAYVTTVPSSIPNCVGGSADTTPCQFTVNGLSFTERGITATLFDSNGNLFLVSEPVSSGSNGIYEVPAAALAAISGGGVNATAIYTSDVNTIASIALDARNNLFFTDSQFGSTPGGAPVNMGDSQTYASHVYELANTGSASAPAYSNVAPGQSGGPVLLQTFTNASSQQGSYNNVMSGLAADQTNGVVYFSTKSDGIWAFANSGTPFTSTSLPTFYAVSGTNGRSAYAGDMTGGKALAVGAPGTLYAVGGEPSSLNYVDDLYMLTIGSLTTPTAQYQGSIVSAPVTVVDNALASCPAPAANLSFTFSGTDASDFLGNQGAGCSSIAGGSGWNGSFSTPVNASSYPSTIQFNPQTPNTVTTTLTVSDTANGGVGSATIASLAQTTPQTIAFTAPTTTTYTYTAPPSPVTITLSASNGGSNNPIAFSIDTSSTGAGTISATTVSGTTSSATLTVTQAGTIQIDAAEQGGVVGGVYYNTSNTATLPLTINPATQSIAFTAIAGAPFTYSTSPAVTVSLSANGGASGNPVTFAVDPSSTGAGTVSTSTMVGNASLATLTVTQAGSIVIDATQAGTTNYAPVTVPVQQTIQVNPAAQTIAFIPPSQPIHFIAGGITVQVSATGGPSNNPIVFTRDSSSTMTGTFGTSTVSGGTSTATLTIPAQGSVIQGSIVIDATQAASTDYAAVTVQPLATITILGPLPTQTITFNNPGTQVVGTALTLSATSGSGLPVSFASGTGSVCTVSGTAVTFASTITAVSTCTIVAAQPGDNTFWAAAPTVSQSFTVNPKGQNPNINLNLSQGSLTIQPGTVGLTQLTITSQANFTGSVSLACSGLPSGYTCSFNPATIVLAEGGTATTTLTVTPPATTALIRHETRPLIPVTALAVVLCFLGFKKRSRLQFLVILALGAAALAAFSACGGTVTSSTTQPVTSSATITVAASGMSGASGSVQQTTTLSVTLE